MKTAKITAAIAIVGLLAIVGLAAWRGWWILAVANAWAAVLVAFAHGYRRGMDSGIRYGVAQTVRFERMRRLRPKGHG